MGVLKVTSVILAGVLLFSCNQKQSGNKQTNVNINNQVYFTYSDSQKLLIENLFEKYRKDFGFNGCVLIGQKDSIFYEHAFGYADYASNDTLTDDYTFQLASVSKQFTAVAILQLYQQGKLKLTDSIQHFFPEFPFQGITIHQLLVHRAGLANYHYFYQYISTSSDTVLNNNDLIKEMVTKRPAAYHWPDQRFQYSNTGYALLACIVEKVTGMAFEDYLDQNIFKPLDMNTAFAYRGHHATKRSQAATGYRRNWKVAEDNYLDGVLGDKGIYCSVYDLFKWDQGLYKGIIINTDTLEKAFQPMGKPVRSASNYGYGWRIIKWGDADSTAIKIMYHAGWWHGFHSLLIRIPKDTTTIVVLRNGGKGKNVSSESILKILYPLQLTEIHSLTSEIDSPISGIDTIITEIDSLTIDSTPESVSLME